MNRIRPLDLVTWSSAGINGETVMTEKQWHHESLWKCVYMQHSKYMRRTVHKSNHIAALRWVPQVLGWLSATSHKQYSADNYQTKHEIRLVNRYPDIRISIYTIDIRTWNLPNDNRQFGRRRRVSIWSVCKTVSVILPSPYLPCHRTDQPSVCPSTRPLSNKLIRRAWDSSSNQSGCSSRQLTQYAALLQHECPATRP